MARPNPPPVRQGTWVCGGCTTLNLIANADQQCPACGHERDYGSGCCTNPGEYPTGTGFFRGHPELLFSSYSYAQDVYDDASSSSLYAKSDLMPSLDPATEFDDLWICGGCGAENVDWYTECPICGTSKDAVMQLPTFESLPGAGSVGDGVWVCSNCECPNSEIHDSCGNCGMGKA
jgi:hypothetical protein